MRRIKKYYKTGKKFHENPCYIEGQRLSHLEETKYPSRTEVINYLLNFLNKKTNYLEIGVRKPSDNFDQIQATNKYSVDPGIEYKANPVDFKLTSDEFFTQLDDGKILTKSIRFDAIFIDGLHLAPQVDRDIKNALRYLAKGGFIILHDCNPLTEWHAREDHSFCTTPASAYWNGTTWKAFLKWRHNPSVHSCCINSDWGIGILSRDQAVGNHLPEQVNEFYEHSELATHREEFLNLLEFDTFKQLLIKKIIQ